MAGAHLLAMFELPRLSAYAQAYGRAAADELLSRLGRKLANAVGRDEKSPLPHTMRFAPGLCIAGSIVPADCSSWRRMISVEDLT